jgi:hypothetical protein
VGVKRSKGEGDHCPPFSAELKTANTFLDLKPSVTSALHGA